MKKIAMKATQEDWDSVKDLVNSIDIAGFKKFPYLVTDYSDQLGVVSNVMYKEYAERFGRTVYETFDRAIFLDALDIVEEKIWKGSEMQHKNINGKWVNCSFDTEFRLKPINSEVKQLQELAEKLGYKIEKL